MPLAPFGADHQRFARRHDRVRYRRLASTIAAIWRFQFLPLGLLVSLYALA